MFGCGTLEVDLRAAWVVRLCDLRTLTCETRLRVSLGYFTVPSFIQHGYCRGECKYPARTSSGGAQASSWSKCALREVIEVNSDQQETPSAWTGEIAAEMLGVGTQGSLSGPSDQRCFESIFVCTNCCHA